jgi:hypothetical protein
MDYIRVSSMVIEGFADHLRERGMEPAKIDDALRFVAEMIEHLVTEVRSVEDCDQELLDQYLAQLIEDDKSSVERLIAMARYFSFCKRPELFIRLLVILNSYDILPLMEDRVEELFGYEVCQTIFQGWKRPPLGTPPEKYPFSTGQIIGRMEDELTPDQCRDALIWNYHEMPKEAFAKKKARFDAANSIDDFLAEQHRSLVEELNECLRTGKLWYEQEVIPEFVDHITSDQRVQTGIRQGDRIICEKVPYDTRHFYSEKDPDMRRYHYCHCPLVRSAIKYGGPRISPTFCYCSAGFEKIAWDTIFDAPVEVEVLETVLGGGERCVFSISIPKGKMR